MPHDRDLDRELRFHLDERIDDLVAAGLSLDEARRRARLEFGGVLQVKEAVRDESWWRVFDGWERGTSMSGTRFLKISSAAFGSAMTSRQPM